MDQNARQQIIDRLKEANNVLVTVSANPSVDQLAACIGFTLLLNRLGKHGTAVFSGTIPSTIEFLKPDETLEKNTDSLRDFIIALDKSKADKLRYKVEDKIVKIFITPYRTSLGQADLDFSQGDFNVDAVLALGVHERTELDQAITAHGRILHDATVISVNNKDQGSLGAINWVDLNASSLSEMLVELARGLTPDPLDGQMATAFMTGIVAETERFSNSKTTPRTMSMASELMAAGANQQLIASKLQASLKPATDSDSTDKPSQSDDGELHISHPAEAEAITSKDDKPVKDDKTDDINGILGVDDKSKSPIINRTLLGPAAPRSEPTIEPRDTTPSRMTWQPPSLGGQLTANSEPDYLKPDPTTDALTPSASADQKAPAPLLTRPLDLSGRPIQPAINEPGQDKPLEEDAPSLPKPSPSDTLAIIEEEVDSPHLNQDSVTAADPTTEPIIAPAADLPVENIDDARDAVQQAIAAEPSSQPLEPIEALGAQPVDLNLRTDAAPNDEPSASPASVAPVEAPILTPLEPLTQETPAAPEVTATDSVTPTAPNPNPFAPPDTNGINPNNPSIPPSLLPPSQPFDSTGTVNDPTAPPPVPPPLMPPPDSGPTNPPL